MCLGTSESSESFACICPSLAIPQLQPTRMQTAPTLTRWCLVTVCWAPRTTSNRHLSCIHAVQGEHAHRVWSAIYDQSCFSNLNDTETCQEQRIFYRLISGRHALYACLALTPLHSARLVHFHASWIRMFSLYYRVKRRCAQVAVHFWRCLSLLHPQSAATCCFLLHRQSSLSDSKAYGCAATGMHASISAHLSHDYLLDEESDTWGPNLEEFTQRLGNIAVKERVENMYFTYLFVLRAVMKAGPLLASIDYSTGCQGQDTETKRLMQQLVGIAEFAFVDQWTTHSVLLPCNLLATGSGGLLSLLIAFCSVLTASCKYGMLLVFSGFIVWLPLFQFLTQCGQGPVTKWQALQVSNEALKKTCPIPFDEGRLWKGANAVELKRDLQKHFQNITLVMDCVGCEKCKLWGKLQILGEQAEAQCHDYARAFLSAVLSLGRSDLMFSSGMPSSPAISTYMSMHSCRHCHILEDLVFTRRLQ